MRGIASRVLEGEAWQEALEFDTAALARRMFRRCGGWAAIEAGRTAEVAAGREASRGGFSRVSRLLSVMRPVPRRGMQLNVEVAWAGHDRWGQPWPDSWVAVSLLNSTLKVEARTMEAAAYDDSAGTAGGQASDGSRDRRVSPRLGGVTPRSGLGL